MKLSRTAAGLTLAGMVAGFVAGHATALRRIEGFRQTTPQSRAFSQRRTAAESGKESPSHSAADSPGGKAMSAGDALALLNALEKMSWPNEPLETARKYYECELMLGRIPFGEMERIIELSQKADVGGEIAKRVFARYAVRDWDKAMAWVAGRPDARSFQLAAIQATAENHPERGADLLQQILMNGDEGAEWGEVFETHAALSHSFARQGKEAFFRFIDTVPSDTVANLFSNALDDLPSGDIPGFLEELGRRVKENKVNSYALRNVLFDLAASDPGMAIRWIEKMEPGYDRTECETGITAMLVRQGKKEEALDFVKTAMARHAGEEMKYFESYATHLAEDIAFVGQLAGLLPAGMELTKSDVERLEGRVGRTDIVNFSTLIQSPEEQTAYLEGAIERMLKFRSANETDLRNLESRIQKLGLTGENALRIEHALQAARESANGKKD